MTTNNTIRCRLCNETIPANRSAGVEHFSDRHGHLFDALLAGSFDDPKHVLMQPATETARSIAALVAGHAGRDETPEVVPDGGL